MTDLVSEIGTELSKKLEYKYPDKLENTGGIVTAKDSNWLLSWTFNRQPQFRSQPKGQLVGWKMCIRDRCWRWWKKETA